MQTREKRLRANELNYREMRLHFHDMKTQVILSIVLFHFRGEYSSPVRRTASVHIIIERLHC